MRFTLTVFPDGHSILSTEDVLSTTQLDQIRTAFARWKETNGDVLIVGQMKVVSSLNVELDIDPDGWRESYSGLGPDVDP